MPQISLTIVVPSEEDKDPCTLEVAASTPVGDLVQNAKAIMEPRGGDDWVLQLPGRAYLNNSQTLQQAQIQNDDMLYLVPAPLPNANAASRAQPSASAAASASAVPSYDELERARRAILQDPQMQARYRTRFPQLMDALHDPQQWYQAATAAEMERRQAQRQHDQEIDRLNGDWDADSQAKIMEQIRKENLDKEMEAAMHDMPELFGRVTMLYINVEVNGHPVKAFVDSGAQATIMSPGCAERCNVTRLIDDRWSGIARGVGTAKILGRVHRASVKIGIDEVGCAFTVMEGKDVDMLLGLDMLKRYQACIDLNQNRLVFPGGQSVPFLPENEIPKAFEEAADQEPTVSGPGGTTIGTETGVLKGPDDSTKTGASTASQPGAAGTSASAPAPSMQPPASSSSSSSSSQYSQQHINTLVQMGVSREQAIEILGRYNGNLQQAQMHVTLANIRM